MPDTTGPRHFRCGQASTHVTALAAPVTGNSTPLSIEFQSLRRTTTPTRDFLQRRRAGGDNKAESIRALKRRLSDVSSEHSWRTPKRPPSPGNLWPLDIGARGLTPAGHRRVPRDGRLSGTSAAELWAGRHPEDPGRHQPDLILTRTQPAPTGLYSGHRAAPGTRPAAKGDPPMEQPITGH